MAARKPLYLASTGGGTDRPALLRVLVGMGTAIAVSLLVVWLLPPVPDVAGNELLSLLPGLAGVAINGERRALSAHYLEIDKARFHALCRGGKGEKYRVPYVQVREREGRISAVRIRPHGRYSCTEEVLR